MACSSGLIDVKPEFLELGTICFGVLLGSILPDIDHPNSFISKKARITSFFASKAFKHRTTTHSLLVNLVFYTLLSSLICRFDLPLKYCLIKFLNSLGIGIVSHILLDMLTVGGVAILYPITSKRYNLAKLNVNKGKSGIIKENVVRVILVLISTSIISKNYLKFKDFLN